MTQPIEIIHAVAKRLDPNMTDPVVPSEATAILGHVDSTDVGSGTLILFCSDGTPYEVRVRRVTEADIEIDNDGVIPDPITARSDEA